MHSFFEESWQQTDRRTRGHDFQLLAYKNISFVIHSLFIFLNCDDCVDDDN